MGRKGEAMTSSQLIMLVLAIVGFIIVIAFLTQLGTDNYSTDEVCKLSVLSRATAAEVSSGAQTAIPLQCTTSKICLVASSNGECTQFIGEKDVVKVILPKAKSGDEKAETQQAIEIEKTMADSMYNCWNIMGQGKLDLFSTTSQSIGFEQAKSTCVICTRVAIGNDVNSTVLAKVDVNAYMEKNTAPGGSLTYLQAMTDGATSSYAAFTKDGEGAITSTDQVSIEGNANSREAALIFMQVKAPEISDVLKKQLTVAGIAGGGAFVAKPSSLVTAGRFVFSPTGAIATASIAAGVAGVGAYNAWQGQVAAAGYCGEFVTKGKEKNGCSLLQAIPYNVNDIKNLCHSIEGNL